MRILPMVGCLLGSHFVTSTAQAGNRVAFVVGGRRRQVCLAAAARTTTVDGLFLALLLRNAGFEALVQGTDLGREGITSPGREFATKSARRRCLPALQLRRSRHLGERQELSHSGPKRSQIRDGREVCAAIDVDVTLDQTMADSKVKVVLLDAGPDNPFAAQIRSAARTRVANRCTLVLPK